MRNADDDNDDRAEGSWVLASLAVALVLWLLLASMARSVWL